MDLVARPEGRSFLGIARVQVIRRGDQLSRRQGWLLPPLPTLVERLKLLLPDEAQGCDSRQGFHPVWGGGSLERIEQHPAVGSDLIGVLPTFLLFFRQAFLFEPFSIPCHPFG